MLFKNKKRYSRKVREKYSHEVQQYLKENGLSIIKSIYDGALSTRELNSQDVHKVLGDKYPLAPWIDETDAVGQFISILEEAGYVFLYDENGKIHFKDEELYRAIVKNHLKFSGSDILDNVAEYCEYTGGRISYFQMQKVLGLHYPRAPYVNKDDMRACTILFLKEVGLPFNYDDTYVYFP